MFSLNLERRLLHKTFQFSSGTVKLLSLFKATKCINFFVITSDWLQRRKNFTSMNFFPSLNNLPVRFVYASTKIPPVHLYLCCCVHWAAVFVLTTRISTQQWILTRFKFIYCCFLLVFAIPSFSKFWFLYIKTRRDTSRYFSHFISWSIACKTYLFASLFCMRFLYS